jgi:hypothetical protein
MNTLFKVLVFACVFILLFSCGKEDTTPPSWEFTSFNPAPKPGTICGELENEVFFLTGGDTLSFTAIFTDDEELSQYKIDIHENFDCHGHGKTSDWSVLQIIDLNGKEEVINKKIPVPQNVTAGKYHFIIQLVDAAGNQAQNTFLRDIVVFNPTDTVPPVVNVSVPLTSATHTASRGGTVNFQGTVTDNLSLGMGGNGKLVIDYVNQNNQNVFQGKTIAFPESQGTSYNFNENISIHNSVPLGNYTFRVYAYDGVNNLSEPVHLNFTIQ